MVASLLDLPYAAILLIFLALGRDVLRDTIGARGPHMSYAMSLARCSSRLDAIYRTSVSTLYSYRAHLPSDCARLCARFPLISDIDISFRDVPGFAPSDFPPSAIPLPWNSEPGAFPNGLVQNGVKSIQLSRGAVHVRELQAMLENCTALEELILTRFLVQLDGRDAATSSDEIRSFSLERHAGSLKKLTFGNVNVCRAHSDRHEVVDLRWLHLHTMSSLLHLDFDLARPSGYAISELPLLPSLECLVLTYVLDLTDKDVGAIIPSIPRLLSMDLRGYVRLTYRVLELLPSSLDSLEISLNHCLKLPSVAEAIEIRRIHHGDNR